MQNVGQLVRADSWEFPGAADTRLLKTVSNAQEAAFAGANSALQQALQPPPACPPPALNASKPPMAPPTQQQPQVPSLSTASTHTAAKAPEGGAAQQLVLPMRQVSLDAITAADLCGGGHSGKPAPADAAPDRSSIFNDVIEQLAAKEESLPVQTGLYTLPSIQFLESLLEDMDSKTASSGHQPAEPPLYLPLDAFDLPFDDTKPSLRQLIHQPSPFDLPQQHSHHHHAHMQQQHAHHHHHHGGQQQQQQQQVYHISAAATMQQPVAQPAPSHGFIPTSSSMPLLGHAPSSFHGSSHIPHSRSAGPSPVKPSHARRAVSAYADFEYDEMEMSLQMSKSGRMRKVASYAGAKRKVSDVCGAPRLSLPEALPPRQSLGSGPSSHMHSHHHHQLHHHAHHHTHHAAASESDTGATTLDDESDEEVSKGGNKNRKQGGGSSMKKGGKRTTCLNCGCHQTPQWRCGPLGPRTLCNACGVRYKKGLPLNCWPIREGMVLPPGAVLPPGVHIPGVILQPAEDE